MIETPRLTVRLAIADDVPGILGYFVRNQRFHAPFDPARPPDFFTPEYWLDQVSKALDAFAQGKAWRNFIFKKDTPAAEAVIGVANFSEIVRGVFHACYLGYALDEQAQGQGYMNEALEAAIGYAFAPDGLNLHRIMANHLPDNDRSARVLRRLGFEVEGYAHDYLRINGRWRDHVLTALTNKNWEELRPQTAS